MFLLLQVVVLEVLFRIPVAVVVEPVELFIIQTD
jgi:hypothetical protein